MTPAKCFHICTSIKFGARIVAILDFWISVIIMMKLLSLLNPCYDIEYYLYYAGINEITFEFFIFSYLFIIIMFLYANYKLKESTYHLKVHDIYQWLVINWILFSIHIIAVAYVATRHKYICIFYYAIPICIVHAIQIYVVKCFYDDQINVLGSFSLATLSCNNNNNNQVTTRTTDTVLAPHQFIVATGQGVAGVPATTITYPRLHHPETGIATANYPQEYYNPPAYSPSYDLRVEKRL